MRALVVRLLGMGVVCACSTAALAQLATVADAPTSVSIPESPAAVERLDKAREKEIQKQWKAAAEFYQDAITKYGGRVLPTKVSREDEVFQYTGVGERVQERLAKWPTAGLDVYRSAYSQTAADLLAAAGERDVAALDHVFSTYFVTEAGKSAGIRLIDLHLEAGDFFAAAWVGQRLLDLHPTLGPERAMVMFRTALAYHWGSDSKRAAAILDDLKSNHPNDTGSIGGKDVLLADALSQNLQNAPPVPATQPTDADRWPTFGGTDGRGEISSSIAKPGASLRSIPLIAPRVDRLPPPTKISYENADQLDLAAGVAMGIMPVTDGGALFFQDGRHVYAVNVDSGQPLPGWLSSNGAASNGTYGLDLFGRARGEQLTVSLTNDRVLAVMGQMDRQAPLAGLAMAPSVRLVCLDRTNGKPVWTRSTADLPDVVAPLRLGEYNGTPLILGNDSVCVIARGGKANQFEDCYVVCLSLKTGEYKWSTYIGSASRIFDGEVGFYPQDTSEMCLAQGRIFVLSNLGTIAALDAVDGRTIWLNSYPRDVIDNPMGIRNRMNGDAESARSKPWGNNPVIVSDGKVFVLPSEGKDLLVYDGGTGEELKRIEMSGYEAADVLLGIRGTAAVFTSAKNCYCIDWSAYEHESPKDAIRWQAEVTADPLPGEDNLVWGRGFMTNDSVFVPTLHRLAQLSWSKSGRLLSTYPAHGRWPGNEEPGNVLVTSQNVIVAGSKQVSIYTDLELLRRQYEQRIADHPNDAAPRLWFAQVLFTANPNEALKFLDEAIGLAGGIDKMKPGDDRQQIFATALRFAQQSASENTDEAATIDEKSFDRAAAAANSPQEQVEYRLARAGWNLQKKKSVDAIHLCQEILLNPQLRAVNVSENTTAAAQAEATIGDAIRADSNSYSATEQEAARVLTEARKSNDPHRLLEVGVEYPNSKAAMDARQAAAVAFENLGDHHAAIQTLSQMYAATSDPTLKATLIEGLSRNYLALPNGIGPAIDRLTRGAQLMPAARLSQQLVLPDGSALAKISFVDAIASLRRVLATSESDALPNFHLPSSSSAKQAVLNTNDAAVISNVRALVPAMRDFVRNDRVIAWTGSEVSFYETGASSPLGTIKLADQPLAAAWLKSKVLLWTGDRVLLVEEKGSTVWELNLHGLPTLELASDADAISDVIDAGPVGAMNRQPPFIVNGGARVFVGNRFMRVMAPAPAPLVNIERISSVRPCGERVVLTTSSGRLIALDTREGHIAWQLRLASGPIAQLMANPHFTVARLYDSAGSQLVALDTLNGQVIGRRKFGSDESPTPLVNAALSEDGTLALTLNNRLLLKDLYEPWKTTPTDLTAKGEADPPVFAGLNQPDQLIVQQGRVLAAYDDGHYVRVQDLTQLNGVRNPLATGAESNTVSIRLIGSQLFVFHPKNTARYNLMDADDHYIPWVYDVDFPPRMVEMMIGQNHYLLVDDPFDRQTPGSSFVRLLIYKRAIAGGVPRSSDALQADPMIANNNGILSYQAAEGGIYYLSGDWKLHWLKGTENP